MLNTSRSLYREEGLQMKVLIEKAKRRLTVYDGAQACMTCRAALGANPTGPKECEGDGRTPEGTYFVCLVKEAGKYGRSLGLSYPNPGDAQRAFDKGQIDKHTLANVRLAHAQHRRPPWGSPLGGEIYIHEGGAQSDWTQGCIALESADMDRLFPLRDALEEVRIVP